MIAPESELRFHALRLGSRQKAANLYGVSMVRYYQDLPITDLDKYKSGQMVMIAGILAKKCKVCETARELQKFWVHSQTRSGCRDTCEPCRQKAAEKKWLP